MQSASFVNLLRSDVSPKLICSCDEDVDGVMVKDAEDVQIFIEKQKEM